MDWALEHYRKPHLPRVIGSVLGRGDFSRGRSIRVLDMPLFMEGQGWRIPPELTQFTEALGIAVSHEWGSFGQTPYVYITVDQKPVPPLGTQRRAGCHADAWLAKDGEQVDVVASTLGLVAGEIERTYIIHDTLPTEFFPGPFVLDDPVTCAEAQAEFDAVAATQRAVTYPDYSVLRLTPYDVHRSAVWNGRGPLRRTFVKIAFSHHQYNREGNTHNELFDYAWKMVRRSPKREHRWV